MVGRALRVQLSRSRASGIQNRTFPPPLEGEGQGGGGTRDVVLLVDTFNNYFEPENARAALSVLQAAGYTVHLPRATDSARPLCCGRTFLSCGLVEEAKAEARRTVAGGQIFTV